MLGDDLGRRRGHRRRVHRLERVRNGTAGARRRLLDDRDATIEHPQRAHRRAAERAHLVREVLHVPEGELADALLHLTRRELAGGGRVDVDRHRLVGLAQHSGERVAGDRARRVVGELGVELGLEVGGQLATRAALRDGVVDLGDHDVEIDPVRRVRVAQPVTLTFTGSATVPVVFSGFMTSNQCRCSLQS